MQNIGDYLKKFSVILQGGSAQKQVIIDEIKNTVGITLSKEQIEVKDRRVTITASPAIKNSVYIKKNQLLQSLKEKNQHFTDIR